MKYKTMAGVLLRLSDISEDESCTQGVTSQNVRGMEEICSKPLSVSNDR